MLSRVRHWIEERWPLSALIRLGFEEEIPGGASYAYVIGSATLIIFIIGLFAAIALRFRGANVMGLGRHDADSSRLSYSGDFHFLRMSPRSWGVDLSSTHLFVTIFS